MRIYFGEGTVGPYVSLSDEGRVIGTEYGKPKEDIIAVMDRVFRSAKIKKERIAEVAVDHGPGGFSSVRRRVAVATALAVSLKAKIAAVGPETQEKAAVLPKKIFSVSASVTPLYVSEPNITAPRRPEWAMGGALRGFMRRSGKTRNET